MTRKIVLIITVTAVFLAGFSFVMNRVYAADQTDYTPDPRVEEERAKILANLCADHGGVNCSAISSEPAVVCNDGTIDDSVPMIYMVPQCRETIKKLADQESELMAKTGCYPPSEITCISNRSYQNLHRFLAVSKLETSDLGKDELIQCRQEIADYQKKYADYKQCLSENKISPFILAGDRMALPILKTVFCSVFYGNDSYYDSNNDLCLCDKGYFKYNGKCTSESLICQSKYGPGYSAKNGNCVKSASLPTKTILSSPKPLIPAVTSSPRVNPTFMPQIIYPTPSFSIDNPNINSTGNLIEEPRKTSFLRNMVNSIISSIKSVLKLF